MSSSVKLRNNNDKRLVSYKEVTDNIQELQELSELPDFVVVNDIGGGTDGGSQNIVQLVMFNEVVWHKSCRSVPQNVRRVR